MNAGARVDGFPLLPDGGWRPDLEALEQIATPATTLIAITSPNNPVGTVLTPQVMTCQVTATANSGLPTAEDLHCSMVSRAACCSI